jgi:hypothetical protein
MCEKKNLESSVKCGDCFVGRDGKIEEKDKFDANGKKITSSSTTARMPAPSGDPAKPRKCLKCSKATAKAYFCEDCATAHEKKLGKPWNGDCIYCAKCGELSMNEKYCDDCSPLSKKVLSTALTAPARKLNSCKKCEKSTVKKFFCEDCAAAHEMKIGRPWNGDCANCVVCNEWTMNEKYCDDCSPLSKKPVDKKPAIVVNPALTTTARKLNSCKKCKKSTVKKFFCEDCAAAHEKKIGRSWNGDCANCVDCNEWTMNEKYCDDCEAVHTKTFSSGSWYCKICSKYVNGSSTKCPTCSSGKDGKIAVATRSCKKCKKETTKAYFCEDCASAHEKKLGKPWSGDCAYCVKCNEITMNEKYCDKCAPSGSFFFKR